MPHLSGRPSRRRDPETWPGLIWRLAELGGGVWRRGVLLILLLIATLGIAALLGGNVVTAVISHFP